MNPRIEALAQHYAAARAATPDDGRTATLQALYEHSVRQRAQSVIDIAADCAALYALVAADRIDYARITPQMAEAFERAFPDVALDALTDRSPEALQGYLNAWKGVYFEVLVRDRLNEGEWVGDLLLEPGQTARLAESPTQAGWDLKIVDVDGTTIETWQIKATESLRYVRSALERYPDIQIIATDEAADAARDLASDIFPSGVSDRHIETALKAPLESLYDTPFEDLIEAALPGLPFLLIVVGEGRLALVGRKPFARAFGDALTRGATTSAAMGIGWLTYALAQSLPFSFLAAVLTRYAIDRHRAVARAVKRVEARRRSLYDMYVRYVA